jgi:hypothetical protein
MAKTEETESTPVETLSPEERAVLWRRLCDEADRYVTEYVIKAEEYCSRYTDRHEQMICVEEAVKYLSKGGKSRHTSRSSLIAKWWQEHVPNDWERAMKKWQKEVTQ